MREQSNTSEKYERTEQAGKSATFQHDCLDCTATTPVITQDQVLQQHPELSNVAFILPSGNGQYHRIEQFSNVPGNMSIIILLWSPVLDMPDEVVPTLVDAVKEQKLFS